VETPIGGRHGRPGDVFMDTLKRDGRAIAPGVYNPMGARIAMEIYKRRKKENKPVAYNAVYLGGWSASAMLLRRPDMGFIQRHLMELIGRHAIMEAHPLPVIMDAETGFGTEVTLTDTVDVYHRIGVALAHMEDQDESATRRCGNLGGKLVVPEARMIAKIKSWLMASYYLNTSMRLMVRTDALTAANGGLENAIERGKRYMDVEYKGLRPTVLWADAMIKPSEIDRWIEAMRKHDPEMILGINYSPNKDWNGYYQANFKRPAPTYDELYRDGKGFQVIWHTILQARADMESTWDTFEDMAENGQLALWRLHDRQREHPVSDAQGMSGAREWQAYERFLGGDEADKRYKESEGYKG